MGIHESKWSSSSSSSSSSSGFASSFLSRDRSRRFCRRNYSLIASSNNNKHVGVSVAAETSGENKEDLAVCLASISLMALTGEDAQLPKPGSSFPSAAAATASVTDRSFRNPFGRKKSSAANWTRSSSTCDATPASAVECVSASAAAAPSIKTVGTKLREKLRRRKQPLDHQHQHHHQKNQHQTQLMEDDRILAEHFNAHIQLLDCLEREEEDDSTSDWATMRSWLVWCLQNKLGDIESTSGTASETEEQEEEADPSSSFRITNNAGSSFCHSSNGVGCGNRRNPMDAGHHYQLRRQLALDERSRRSFSASRVLRRQETSLDGAAVCSPQSSFESYGSTGTGGGS